MMLAIARTGKILRLGSLFTLLISLLAISSITPAVAADAVVGVKAISGVPAPIAFQTPVATVTATTSYTGTVTWSPTPANSRFVSGVIYTATITLTAKTGYTFTGVTANFFTVSGATTVTNSANSGVVTAVFPANNSMAIAGVQIPRAFATPVAAVTAATGYTGTVTWSPAPVDGKFVVATTYTATITLTPKAGQTFTGVIANFFTVTGSTSRSNLVNSGVVTAVFPATSSLYNGTNGIVACGTSGFFSITNKGVTGRHNCRGSVVIPDGVTAIGEGAFDATSGYGGLGYYNEWNSTVATEVTSLTIPNSVTAIGSFAFRNLKVTELNLPNSIATVGQWAFADEGRSTITSLNIPSSLTVIPPAAFYNFKRVTSLTIPNGVTTIQDSAFADFAALTSLTLPTSLSTLGPNVFNGSVALRAPNLIYCGIVSTASLTAAKLNQVPFCPADSTRATITTQPVGGQNTIAFATQPVVTIVDANGNTATNSTVKVRAVLATGNGVLSGTTTVTAVAGVATFTNLVYTGIMGDITLHFLPVNVAIPVTSGAITITPGPDTRYLVTSSSNTPLVGGNVTISAQLADVSGNAVPTADRTVTWTKSNANGSFASATSTTNASGIASIVFTTHTVSGTVSTVTATSSTPSRVGTTANITTQVGPAAKYLVTSSSNSPVAGTNVTITARLADSFDNAVGTAGKTVTWTKSDSNGTFSTITSTTNASGVATVVFTTFLGPSTATTVTAVDNTGVTGTSTSITTTALTVTYDSNSGSAVANGSTTSGGSVGVAPTEPTRSGYTFAGWSATNGGSAITFPYTHGQTSNFTLYAKWTPNAYVLTYVYNNATSDSSTVTSNFTTGGSAIILPTPARTGYTFGGWYSEIGLTTSIGDGGASYSPTGSSLTPSAYAKWTGIARTVTYSAASKSGGDVPTDAATYIIGSNVAIQGNPGSLTRTGYTFDGWTYASDGSGTVLRSGMTYTTGTSNMIFYAKWIANTYTITYNANNGAGIAQRNSSNVETDSYTSGGTAVTLPLKGTMARTGYTFGGWNTSAAGSGTNYLESDTATVTSNVTLFAKWAPVTYSITYDANTGTGTAPTTGSYVTGQALPYAVLENTFTKSSNIFGGWNTASDKTGTNYSPGSTITTLSNITLYAIWIPQYTLHYAINGGTVSPGTTLPADTLYTDDTNVGPVFSTLTRTGYTFAGWTNGAATIEVNGSFRIKSDSVLTAKWTAIPYTATFDPNGGSTTPSTITRQIDQNYSLPAAITKTGYTFTHWLNGTTQFGADAPVVMGSSSLTYVAQWRPNVYSISYDWNGGTGSTTNDDSFTVGNSAVTLPLVGDHVKDGSVFGGWSATRNGTAVGATYTPTANTTLYARWGLGNFIITYNANGGSVGINSTTVLNGDTFTLPAATRTSYVLQGWYTAATGGTLAAAGGASYTPTQTRTLYARWIQASLYGIAESSLTRIGTTTASSSSATTFTSDNGVSSVSVSVPAGALPNGTTINFDLVGDYTRAQSVLTAPNTYIISLVVSWVATDGTVPDTAVGKPISMTVANSTIKIGAKVYAIVSGVSTLLGTATQDGTVTVSITSDPEVVIVSTKSTPPVSVTATSNVLEESEVSWTAPTNNGGSEITRYTVTTNTGQTCVSTTTSCTLTSLLNETVYTFTVTATNSNGTSAASESATARTGGKPTAPTSVTATAGGTRESVISWLVPAFDGGASIDSYTATANGGAFCTSTETTCTITELADGTTYTFTVTATNSYGTSISSSSASAKTADATSGGGGGGGGDTYDPPPAPTVEPTPPAPVKSNVTITPPVTVVGNKDAKVITVEITTPAAGSNIKPAILKLDAASEKFIAEAKIAEGKLTLKPEAGFSGKKTVTVTITENGADRIVQIPLTVLPENVTKPVVSPTTSTKSVINWTKSPNANAYTVYLDGKQVCSTAATSCTVRQILGPNSVVEIVSNGGDRTISEKVGADFKQAAPIVVTRIVSATITKGTLSKVDTTALDKVVTLIKTRGFSNVVISNITTTKRTEAAAAARIAAIKKYINEKTGLNTLTFEVVPAASRTYFNNIALKG
jgi:uncharacterized repeat protein (TIGR02543 family)